MLVAAAGNDGDATVNYPAAYPEVVRSPQPTRATSGASFSNANADVEVAAPGVNILSSTPAAVQKISGTSMATPHAAGVTGDLWHITRPTLASTIRSRLDAAVDDLGAAGRASLRLRPGQPLEGGRRRLLSGLLGDRRGRVAQRPRRLASSVRERMPSLA